MDVGIGGCEKLIRNYKKISIMITLIIFFVYSITITYGMTLPSFEGEVYEVQVGENLARSASKIITDENEAALFADELIKKKYSPRRVLIKGTLNGKQYSTATNAFAKKLIPDYPYYPDFIEVYRNKVTITDAKLSGISGETSQLKGFNDLSDILKKKGFKVNKIINCNYCSSGYKRYAGGWQVKHKTFGKLNPAESILGVKMRRSYSNRNINVKGASSSVGTTVNIAGFLLTLRELDRGAEGKINRKAIEQCYEGKEKVNIAIPYYTVNGKNYAVSKKIKTVNAKELCGCKRGDDAKIACCADTIKYYYNINDLIKQLKFCTTKLQKLDEDLISYGKSNVAICPDCAFDTISDTIGKTMNPIVNYILESIDDDDLIKTVAIPAMNKVVDTMEESTADYLIKTNAYGCHKDHLGGQNYCTYGCKCEIGEGDCDYHNQCKSGYCKEQSGTDFCAEKLVPTSKKTKNKSLFSTWFERFKK